jgi:protein-disulfide isomerase
MDETNDTPQEKKTSSEPTSLDGATSSDAMASELNLAELKKTEKKFSGWSTIFMLLIPVAFFIGLGIGYVAWGQDLAQTKQALTDTQETAVSAEAAQQNAASQAQANPQAVAVPQQQEPPQDVVRYDVPVDDDPGIGPEDAAITIVEFSDYQCPYCQRWHAEVYTKLLVDYPDEVRIVYRDFPLTSIHSEAVPAAEAANCAFEQGSFWEYHDKLFSGELTLGQDAYLQYASSLGLDMENFEECVASRRYADEVQADFQYAANLGVQSTPTFFLNGIPIVGAQPYEVFKQIIDMELAGEIP